MIVIALLLCVGVALALASNDFIERCLGVKLLGDSLAVMVLFASGPSTGDVQAICFSIISITTIFVFLLVIVGRRHFVSLTNPKANNE